MGVVCRAKILEKVAMPTRIVASFQALPSYLSLVRAWRGLETKLASQITLARE